jgi:hypothetical protein
LITDRLTRTVERTETANNAVPASLTATSVRRQGQGSRLPADCGAPTQGMRHSRVPIPLILCLAVLSTLGGLFGCKYSPWLSAPAFEKSLRCGMSLAEAERLARSFKTQYVYVRAAKPSGDVLLQVHKHGETYFLHFGQNDLLIGATRVRSRPTYTESSSLAICSSGQSSDPVRH